MKCCKKECQFNSEEFGCEYEGEFCPIAEKEIKELMQKVKKLEG